MTETNQDKKNNNDKIINNFLTDYLIKIYKELQKKYSIDEFNYNLMICNNLVENNPSHLLSLFKDMQLYEISTEYLRRFYESDESNIRLRNICDFYESYSKIFPNYYALPEKDFIFKNIKKKKKILDEKNKKIEKEISNGYKGINDVFFDKKVEKEMKKIDDINVKENEDSLFQNNLSISIISKNRYPTGDIENGKVGESVIMNNNSSVIENSTMSIEKGILNVLDDSKIYPEDLANLIKNDINDKKKKNNNNNTNKNKNNNNNKKAHMKSNDILSPGRGNYNNNNNKTHNNKYYSGSNKKNINHNDKSNEKKDKSRDNTKDKTTKNKDDKLNINKKKKSLTNNNKNENQLFSPQPSRRNINKTTNKNVSNFNTIPSKNKENKENKENKDNKDNKDNKENKTEKKNQKMFKTLTINDTNKITDKKKDNNNNKKNKLTKQNSNIVGMREKDKEKINSAFKTKHIYKRNRECLLSDNINGPILSLGNSNKDKEDVSLININNKTINNNKKSTIISNKKTGLIKRNSFDKRHELFSPKHFKTKTETSFSSKNIKFENKLKMEGNSSPNNKNNNNNNNGNNDNKTITNTPEKSSLTEHKDSTTIESKGFLTSTPSATNINCKPLAIKVNRKVYITKKSTDNID